MTFPGSQTGHRSFRAMSEVRPPPPGSSPNYSIHLLCIALNSWTGSGANIGFLFCPCGGAMRPAQIVDSVANDRGRSCNAPGPQPSSSPTMVITSPPPCAAAAAITSKSDPLVLVNSRPPLLLVGGTKRPGYHLRCPHRPKRTRGRRTLTPHPGGMDLNFVLLSEEELRKAIFNYSCFTALILPPSHMSIS
jgi:hypothetical protein